MVTMKRTHRGIHHDRTKHQVNALEQRFARAWRARNAGGLRFSDAQTLKYLLASPIESSKPDFNRVPEAYVVSGRDAEVAATVIQWLGTAEGQRFLKEVLGG